MKKMILSVLTVMTFVGTIASTQVASAQFPPPPPPHPRPFPQPNHPPMPPPHFPPQRPPNNPPPNFPPHRPPPPAAGRWEVFSFYAEGAGKDESTKESIKEATIAARLKAKKECTAYPGGALTQTPTNVNQQCARSSKGNSICRITVLANCQYYRYY